MSIGLRLREERERLGYTQPVFAELAGTTKKSQIDYEKDITQPKAGYLYEVSKVGVDVQYVITGNRSLSLGQKEQNSDLSLEFSLIPVRNVIVSAGHGANNDCESVLYNFAYRKDWLKNRGLFEKDLEIIVVRGDSMEPTINDGDSILINTAENEPQDGHIYVIRSCDTLWVKRIQRQLDGGLLLLSDNKTYPPMKLDLETTPDIQIIGKVVNSSKNFY